MESKLQILVIDAFDWDSSSGRSALKTFKSTIAECLKTCKISDNLITWRRMNHLQDYVVDWEYSRLDEESRSAAKLFDSTDLIICGGDLSLLPWNPRLAQLVGLMNMVNKVDKPLLALGSTALLYIYTLSTAGRRFHVLNGPNGGPCKDIASFPIYSTHHGVFPGAYLDNEFGDLYTYNLKVMEWVPTCNTGLRFVSQVLSSHQPLPKKNFSRENRVDGTALQNSAQDPRHITNISTANTTAYIVPVMQSHPYLKRFGDDLFFVIQGTNSRNWQAVFDDGGVPRTAGSKLKVLATSHCGSVLFSNGNSVLTTAGMGEKNKTFHDDDGKVVYTSAIYKLTLSWLDDIISRTPDGNICRLIYNFLFPSVLQEHLRGDRYDSLLDKEMYVQSPPIGSTNIKTSILPHGPRKVDPPAMNMFYFYDIKDESNCDGSYVSPPKSSNARTIALSASAFSPSGSTVSTLTDTSPFYRPSKFKTPILSNTQDMRLKNLLDSQGYSETKAVVDMKRSIDDSLKITWKSRTAKVPDIVTGLTFDGTHIMPRRRPVGDRLVATENVVLYSPNKIDQNLADSIVFDDEEGSLNSHLYHAEHTALGSTNHPGLSHITMRVNVIQEALTPGRNRVRGDDEIFLIPGEYNNETGKIETVMHNLSMKRSQMANSPLKMSPSMTGHGKDSHSTYYGSQSVPNSPRLGAAPSIPRSSKLNCTPRSPRSLKNACIANYLPLRQPAAADAISTQSEVRDERLFTSGTKTSHTPAQGYSPGRSGISNGSATNKGLQEVKHSEDYDSEYSSSVVKFAFLDNSAQHGKVSPNSKGPLHLDLNFLEISDSIYSKNAGNEPIHLKGSPRSYYFKKREKNELNLEEEVKVYKTPYERERADYMMLKEKFLDGDFKTLNTSPMPVRQPSLLADASYPDSPRIEKTLHYFEPGSIKTLEGAILMRDNDIEKRVAGPWRPIDTKGAV